MVAWLTTVRSGGSERPGVPDARGRQVRHAERNGDGEGRPAAVDTLDADLAAVELHQLPDERKSDARPLVGSRPAPLDAVEPLEDVRQLLLGNPGPGVADGQFCRVAVPSERDRDLAFEGELEGVGEEVEDHFLPHVPVHVHRLGKRRAVHGKPDSGLRAGRAEVTREFGGKGGEVGRFVVGLNPAGFDAREVEEGVDQLLEAQAVAVNHLQAVALPALSGVVQGVLDGAEHERQRRPELVTHVREEGGLRLIQLGQGFGPAPLLLVGTGVAEHGRKLTRDEIEEAPILVVERPAGADAREEEAREPPLGLANGKDKGLPRGELPRPPRQVAEPCPEVADVHRRSGPHGLGKRPPAGVRAAQVDKRWAVRPSLTPVGCTRRVRPSCRRRSSGTGGQTARPKCSP